MRFVVGDDEAGARLDVVVARHLEVSRSRAAARIASGEVSVDGVVAAKGHRLAPGERVAVTAPAQAPAAAPPPMPDVRYQDDHVLVVVKPAGLVVHPGPGHPDGTLVDALQGAGYELPSTSDPRRPGIVHRLDRGTSGLLLVARSPLARDELGAQLRSRTVTRRYLTLALGVPRSERGRIEAPVGRDPTDRLRFAVVAGGKSAVTRYRTLAVGAAPKLDPPVGSVSLLACQLETGRTHQIRVHLSRLGHPVLGDPLYGRGEQVAHELGLRRMFLHAARLSFRHPVTGTWVSCDEPLPDELVGPLERTGIDAAAWRRLPDDAGM